ncbi:AMP-binding protein, partial [Rhodococcoides fascians]|uniref:AMP-binding protein n=1 Tax=Rhodococcoides fascians TaxID=1828 RepID=UPI001FC97C27
MRAAVSGESHGSLPPEGGASEPFPLSSAQRGMWFAQQLAPSVPVCIAQYVDLRGDLDLELLRKSTRQAGHEFQSAFIRLFEVDGEPMQVIDHSIDDSVDYLDLRSEDDPMAAAKTWIDRNYTAPVDVTTDRLVDVWILHVEDDRYLWYSKIHHVALDGYGAMTMVNRTAELYTAEQEGTQPPPAKAAELQKLYQLDQEYRSSGRFESDRDYWVEHVGHARGGASLANTPGATVAASTLSSEALRTEIVDALEASDATKGATSAAVVIAAFACYLARVTGRDEVLINIPVSARTTALLRRSGGMLVNVAPLSIRVDPDGTVGDLVQQVQLELMGALRHQRFSLEDIRRELATRGRDADLTGPMVNVMLFHQQIQLGSIAGEFNIVTSGPVEDLLVNIYQSGSPARTFVDFRGNPNRYVDEDLVRHHRTFVEVVDAFVEASPHDAVDTVHRPSADVGRIRRAERSELDYWTSVLSDAPSPVGFAGFDSAGSKGERTGAPTPRTASASIDAATHRGLLSAANHQNASVLVSVHSALAVLLSRLADETDISIGVRTRSTDGNVVVLRSSVDAAESFSDLGARLRDIDSAALAHAGASLESVGATVNSAGSTKADLIRVLLSFGVEDLGEDLDVVDVVVTVHETFDALGVPAGMSIRFVHDSEADDGRAQAHLDRLVTLLRSAATDPARPVGDVDVLTSAERAALVPVRGASSVGGQLLPEIFASAVKAAGVSAEALVVAGSGAPVTYGELDSRSTAVAELLVARGVGVGSFVAVGLRRSVEYVIAVWAVAKAGGAFVPVDPSYPADRLAHMLSDSVVAVGVSTSEYIDVLAESGPSVDWVSLDESNLVAAETVSSPETPRPETPRPETPKPATPRPVPSLDDAAYLIYTSGSTGVPKGVVVTHRGLGDFVEEERSRFRVTTDSRVLAFASTSFDASVLEVLLAFGGAGTLVIAPTDVYGGSELAAVLSGESVTHAFVTPAALASVDPSGLDDLKVVVTGGDAASAELVERWGAGRSLFNAYGPTEATVFSSVSEPLTVDRGVDIGAPISGSEQLVLDSRL